MVIWLKRTLNLEKEVVWRHETSFKVIYVNWFMCVWIVIVVSVSTLHKTTVRNVTLIT